MPATADQRLLVGYATGDDAAVYRLNDEVVIIHTVDFFPPVARRGYEFGQVAAANALSDIYAMGGHPLMALNVVVFPRGLDQRHLAEILRGGADKLAEAGAVLGGGHTVCGDEPMYGLAVLGQARVGELLTNAGCRPGDVLFLTKPLGTGAVLRALMEGALDAAGEQRLYGVMSRLNRAAAAAARLAGARGCTDITGFGFLGHAAGMARASGVTLEVDASALPWLEGAPELAAARGLPGGAARNQAHFGAQVEVQPGVPAAWVPLMYDPQTSGGLLVAVPPPGVAAFEQAMAEAGESAWRLGRATVPGAVAVRVRG